MAQLYADEDFNNHTVEVPRLLGHDVLTAQQAGQANQKSPILKSLPSPPRKAAPS